VRFSAYAFLAKVTGAFPNFFYSRFCVLFNNISRSQGNLKLKFTWFTIYSFLSMVAIGRSLTLTQEYFIR
jgi:hypothetical protein